MESIFSDESQSLLNLPPRNQQIRNSFRRQRSTIVVVVVVVFFCWILLDADIFLSRRGDSVISHSKESWTRRRLLVSHLLVRRRLTGTSTFPFPSISINWSASLLVLIHSLWRCYSDLFIFSIQFFWFCDSFFVGFICFSLASDMVGN